MAPSNMVEWEVGFAFAAKQIKCGVTNITTLVKDLSEKDPSGEVEIWGANGQVIVHLNLNRIYLAKIRSNNADSWITNTSLAHHKRLGHSPLWGMAQRSQYGPGSDNYVAACGCSVDGFKKDFPKSVRALMTKFCQPLPHGFLDIIGHLQKQKEDLEAEVKRLRESTMANQIENNLGLKQEVEPRIQDVPKFEGNGRNSAVKTSILGKRARNLADADTDRSRFKTRNTTASLSADEEGV